MQTRQAKAVDQRGKGIQAASVFADIQFNWQLLEYSAQRIEKTRLTDLVEDLCPWIYFSSQSLAGSR